MKFERRSRMELITALPATFAARHSGELMALADASCYECSGSGVMANKFPCPCALRAVFRACLRKYQSCVEYPGEVSTAGLTWSRKREEYAADFVKMARRALNDRDFNLFRRHYVRGIHWLVCNPPPEGVAGRGRAWRELYDMQKRLGWAAWASGPYSLYPVVSYFSARSQMSRQVNLDYLDIAWGFAMCDSKTGRYSEGPLRLYHLGIGAGAVRRRTMERSENA